MANTVRKITACVYVCICSWIAHTLYRHEHTVKDNVTLSYQSTPSPECLLRHTCVCIVQPLSRVQLFATPWTLACQAPLSMGFPKEEYWSGLPLPPPGDPPSPGMEPLSPALAGRFSTLSPQSSVSYYG